MTVQIAKQTSVLQRMAITYCSFCPLKNELKPYGSSKNITIAARNDNQNQQIFPRRAVVMLTLSEKFRAIRLLVTRIAVAN